VPPSVPGVENLSSGRAVHSFFPPAVLPVAVSLREKLCGAIPGERLGDRVSRPRRRPPRSFPGGAVVSRILKCCPSGKCTERGRSVVGEFTVTLMRSRRPGMESRVQGQQDRRRRITALEGNDLGGRRRWPGLGCWRARRGSATLPIFRNVSPFQIVCLGKTGKERHLPIGRFGRSCFNTPPLAVQVLPTAPDPEPAENSW